MTEYLLLEYDETEEREIDRRDKPWTQQELAIMEVKSHIEKGEGWGYLCCKAEDFEAGKIVTGSPKDSEVFVTCGDFREGNGDFNEVIINEGLELWLEKNSLKKGEENE